MKITCEKLQLWTELTSGTGQSARWVSRLKVGRGGGAIREDDDPMMYGLMKDTGVLEALASQRTDDQVPDPG